MPELQGGLCSCRQGVLLCHLIVSSSPVCPKVSKVSPPKTWEQRAVSLYSGGRGALTFPGFLVLPCWLWRGLNSPVLPGKAADVSY